MTDPMDPAVSEGRRRRLLLIAGLRSHGPGEHEFEAGVLLLKRCLATVPGLEVEIHQGGWVGHDSELDSADAIVIYSDGDAAHPAAMDGRLERLRGLMRRGIGLGCLHYSVAVGAGDIGASLLSWLGGYYEGGYSCNPKWEARFDSFPEHPITKGVRPFRMRDEWYFNIRFAPSTSVPDRPPLGTTRFTPILVATPSDAVRRGPYVHPPGPYPHIVAATGRNEILAWAIERPDGGRGFGFTGGHYHANWGQDDVRRLVLNAVVWLTGANVPQGGVESHVDTGELDGGLRR
ncbi:MAG: ThuA domain-containing protein [Chloroflexi bacterium]|nr:ThuA domain-containing protein [Chloroflexota bacterium]